MRFFACRWFAIDLRSLGLFRIGFGLCLIANLLDHAGGGRLTAFYSNDGVLTNHFSLFLPLQPRAWSLLYAFSTPAEVAVAFAAIFLVYALYTLGWRTRVMQVLVVVCFVSLVNRNLLLQDGGSFVCTILAVWTAFLPLGARLSLDRWIGGSVAPDAAPAMSSAEADLAAPGRHVSLVCFALMLQLAVIYGFNAANKTGDTWRDGTAVHYVLWLNHFNTSLAGFLRLHEPAWLSPLLTRATLVFEWGAPALILTPVLQVWSRRVLIACMCLFHGGIAALLTLGPFAYAMLAYALLLIGPGDWALIEPRARRLRARLGVRLSRVLHRSRARSPAAARSAVPARRLRERPHRGAIALREAAALTLLVAMAAELTLANDAVPTALRLEGRPAWMAAVTHYLRIYQTWGMFAPDVPVDSGRLVADARLADGSHVDPLTGAPPDFEAPRAGPDLLGHDWGEYMFYYPWERHRAYRAGLCEYLARLHAARGWPADKQLRAMDVYAVSARSPPPGELGIRDLKRQHLASHTPAPPPSR